MFRRTIVFLTVALAACTGSTATSTTSSPVTPTTNTVSAVTTTGSQSIVLGGLIPADPPTLVPIPDQDPLIVARWHEGIVSPDGRWVAVRSALDAEATNQINIVDLETTSVVVSDTGSGDGLRVDDRGRAVWFEKGVLKELTTAGERPGPPPGGPVPPALYDTLTLLADGKIAYLSGPEEESGPVSIVQIDGPELTNIELNLEAGPPPAVDPCLPSRDYIAPDVAWADDQNEAFVVSATDNRILAVDLETGAASSHRFESSTTPGVQGVGRDIYVNPTATVLLIATRVLDVEGDSCEFEARDYAADLVVVDTTDWTSQTLNNSVWSLVPAPDNSRLVGLGASITHDSNGDSKTLQSPVYLFDGESGRPLVGFEGRSGTISDAQFSGDAAELYVRSQSEDGTNIDIIDVATQELAGSVGFARISLIGEAGLMAFHLQD